MELMVRCCFQVPLPDHFKEEVRSKILKNEDVLFYWSLISADWEDGESKALLMMIIDMWITIRGFSFASAWIEKYKLANKKSVQKSKGVRKQLIPPPTDT